jgi:hypothetical protein
MTNRHILKQTLINFYREHRTLVYVLGGMIGLPIIGAAILGVLAVILWALTYLFGGLVGTLLFVFGAIGAIAGLVAAKTTQEAEYE